MSDNARCQTAAAIRQWCYRRIVIAKIAESRDAGAQPGALPVAEEKRLVRLDRPAERSAIYVAAEFRLGTGLGEEVTGIQSFIPEEFEDVAMEPIGPGFSKHHDRSTVRP